jgi:hypothetical protein
MKFKRLEPRAPRIGDFAEYKTPIPNDSDEYDVSRAENYLTENAQGIDSMLSDFARSQDASAQKQN